MTKIIVRDTDSVCVYEGPSERDARRAAAEACGSASLRGLRQYPVADPDGDEPTQDVCFGFVPPGTPRSDDEPVVTISYH